MIENISHVPPLIADLDRYLLFDVLKSFVLQVLFYQVAMRGVFVASEEFCVKHTCVC